MAEPRPFEVSDRVVIGERDAEIAALKNRCLVLAQLLDNAEQANAGLTQELYAAQSQLAQITAAQEPDGPKGDDDTERPSLPN